ncbi:MAG: hypothetical protein HYV63_34630 [Candidatus Schekmanbacteria bacterium]|nr:hypothetical protein [Candidatus Schekmanbacteria bacterium]
MFFGTFRGEETTEELSKISALDSVASMRLDRLGLEGVTSLVGDVLAIRPAPMIFCKFLARCSEGNPFFVGEYVRAAVESRMLWRDDEGAWQVGEEADEGAAMSNYEALPLPSSIRLLVQQRLGRLSRNARKIARVAAIVGRECPLALLRPATGLGEEQIADALGELARREMMDIETSRVVRFAHDRLREGARGQIRPSRRPGLHRRVAKAYEAVTDTEITGAEVASHWEQGGEPETALPYYLAAARKERDHYAWSEAETCYRAYLRLAPDSSPNTVQARWELGDQVLCTRGALRQAIAELDEALVGARRAGAPELEARIIGSLGKTYRITGPMDRARAYLEQARQACEQALTVFREIGDPRGEGIAMKLLATLHLEQGQMERARELADGALAIHRKTGFRPEEGAVLGDLALLALMAGGDTGAAAALGCEGEAIYAPLGNKVVLGEMLCIRGHIELAADRSGSALLARARELAEAAGAGPDSALGKAIQKLQRATAAFEAGEHCGLFRGHKIEDIPEGLRRWLVDAGHLAPDRAGLPKA